MKIAFFTALKEEQQAVRLAWPMQRSGTLMGFPFDTGDQAVCISSGIGSERMAKAVEHIVSQLAPDLAILIGFSAGLRDDIAIGEVICDDSGDTEMVRSLRQFPYPIRFGKLVSTELLKSAQDKQQLATQEPLALAADMESDAFKQGVGSIPWLILRSITDEFTTDLSLPYDKFLSDKGFPSESAIIGKVLQNPRLIPNVWELAKGSATAQSSLTKIIQNIKPLLLWRLNELA